MPLAFSYTTKLSKISTLWPHSFKHYGRQRKKYLLVGYSLCKAKLLSAPLELHPLGNGWELW
jgi:hypothetical protein